MEEQTLKLIIVLSIPFFSLVVCWISLMLTMRRTTGELKYWLTPENLIKGVTIVFIITSVMGLAVLEILDGDVIGTILSGIIGYTLGTKFLGAKE